EPSGTASTAPATACRPASGEVRSASRTPASASRGEPGQRVTVTRGDRGPAAEGERYRSAGGSPVRVVAGRPRRHRAGGQGPLAVPLDAFRVGAVQWQAGEELRGHAAAAARVIRRAGLAGPAGLRLAQPGEQLGVLPYVREPARVADVAGPEAVVDGERAGVHVADRVDQAHH